MKEEAKAKLELIAQQEKCLAEQKAKLLEEINKKESGWFVPEIRQRYWLLNNTGYHSHTYLTDKADKPIMECQIVRETKAEIIRDDKKRKATIKYLKAIAEENDGEKVDWRNSEQKKWLARYDHDTKLIFIGCYHWSQYKDSDWYSVSRKAAERALSVLTEEEIELVFKS